ncbi:MAG: NUDIX domain-containing protein [bacterium]|nr:NUDIX domain-containing protein [bacterium]
MLRGNNHVLMVRQPKEDWRLPGGEAEEGETPEVALERIIKKQTGAEVVITRHLTRAKDVHAEYRLRLTFFASIETQKYDPSIHHGQLEVDWRSLRSPELRELIYGKHLKVKE